MRWLLTLSVKVSRVRTVSSHSPCINRMPTTMKLGREGGRLKFFFFGGSVAMSGVITTTPPGPGCSKPRFGPTVG